MRKEIPILTIFIILVGCQSPTEQERSDNFRVFYLNSYHEGYPSSDEVMEGIMKVLDSAKVEVAVQFMNTKQKNQTEDIEASTQSAIAAIENFKPDVLIASDDNAVKYVVAEKFKNGPFPVVFCGVNWSAEQYQLPKKQVTGMLEVLPITQTVNTMKTYFPGLKKVFILTEDSNSEKKSQSAVSQQFAEAGVESEIGFAQDLETWKTMFADAQATADLLYLPTNGAVKGWDEEEAKAFVAENISKPIITCDDFMMPYAVFGQTKVAKEQGEWAARTALEILSGKSPAEIPVTSNRESAVWWNPLLAKKVGFEPDPTLKTILKTP